MKKALLIPFAALMVACGPSKEEYNSLQQENAKLTNTIDSLNRELDAYKYSPAKMLADAEEAAVQENKTKVNNILSQLMKYHPEAEECKKIQKLRDDLISKEKARAETERVKKEKEKQARLAIVKKMKKKVDDVDNITWYKNPYFTHYIDRTLTSLYMGESASSVWLRLKMSYGGDDWIFFDHAYLSYDGNTHEFKFSGYQDKKTDVDGGWVSEWIDINVGSEDLAFLRQMVNGKSIKMRLSGKYTKTKQLSANEVKAIKEMIMAYDALKAEK